MESDDDYRSFLPPKTSSPSIQTRKLKRLKTATASEDPVINSLDEDFSVPLVDSSGFEAVESLEAKRVDVWNEPLRFEAESVELDEGNPSSHGIEISHFDGDEEKLKETKSKGVDVVLNEHRQFEAGCVGVGEEIRSSFGVESSRLDEDRTGVKRVLEFGVGDGEGENEGEEVRGKAEPLNSGVSGEKKNKNKRVKINGDAKKVKETKSSTRKEAKEREAYLNHLHVETQRLLRNTRDVSFKPVPIVQKPISSVLEKIRQRKQELSKKNVSLNFLSQEKDASSRDTMMDLHIEIPPNSEREGNEIEKVVIVETSIPPAYCQRSFDSPDSNGSIESLEDLGRDRVPSQVVLDEESKHLFRAPVEDTQDLYCENQSRDERLSEKNDSFGEENFAPSLLEMNLKFDLALLDDTSSDEEENDKENITPSAPGPYLSSLPKGDPVKAFFDEDAIEEDDSNNDHSRFKDNEEEDDMEDAEELKNMIATGYEEKPIDDEKRQELHMKWLEQQDAFGTDKLLQKLGCGSKYAETTLLEEEDDKEEDEEESSDEDTEDQHPSNGARMSTRKLRQMIPQMFTDKEDVYVSSDDEETEKLIMKRHLLRKAEDQQAKFLSPLEDENSREVFGLIKKLNVQLDTKKKANISSSFDILSTKKITSSSKTSFLGKESNSSLSSSRKSISSTMRSYIFGRDDSISSSVSMLEDSSDTINKEVVNSTNTFSAKFSNSQSKASSQYTKSTSEITSDTSLFDILRRPSQNKIGDQDDTFMGHAQSIFASFKLSKKLTRKDSAS